MSVNSCSDNTLVDNYLGFDVQIVDCFIEVVFSIFWVRGAQTKCTLWGFPGMADDDILPDTPYYLREPSAWGGDED